MTKLHSPMGLQGANAAGALFAVAKIIQTVNAPFEYKPKGNKNQIMPEDDAIDLLAGAQSIPYEVTDARRCGEKVLAYARR